MRFESKHNYYKELAHHVKCFKNIPKTMAQRHQEFMCYHLNSDSSPFAKEVMVGPGTCACSILLYNLTCCTCNVHAAPVCMDIAIVEASP